MDKIKLKIDNQDVEVAPGTSILEAAKSHKKKIPHYCYHAGLSVAGNCRMCLVKVEGMPKPVISCKTPVAPDMVVDTQSAEVKKMQQNIMEFLLINHPLDCPTCDQAGECRLQDYYMQYDLIPSRFDEEKVDKEKMVNLGAGVMLDEERCIVCTRCVRFCDEVAGNAELFVQNRGDHSMVATFPGKPLENPYAGNTVDVCPVGALTSKDFRYKKRVWFLKKAESICPGCATGCNTEVHHTDQKVYRLKPRHNAEINKYWMCDAGRYDYKFINEKRRLKPAYQQADELVQDSLEDVLQHFENEFLKHGEGLAFVASAQESCEEIESLVELAKSIGATCYYSKNDPENPFSDDILIDADKNPNMHFIQSLGLKPFSEIEANVKSVIIQRNLSANDLKLLEKNKIKVLALFATNETALDSLAETILPIPTYAEQSGHFVNKNGIKQKFTQAFAPRGESQTVAEYTADLLQILLPKQNKSAV